MMLRFVTALLVALFGSPAFADDEEENPYIFSTASAQTAMQVVTALGLTSNLQLVLDAGDSASIADPYWSSVQGLLHFDGSDAATTFTDEAGHTFTAVNQAQLDTAQKKFGTASLLVDGADDLITGDGSADFAFGAGDFTIEGQVRFAAVGATNQVIYDSRPNATSGAYPTIYKDTNDKLTYLANGAAQIVGATSVTTGVFYHWKLSRVGTSTKLCLNGVQEGSTYSDSTTYLNGASRPAMGASGFGITTLELNGWIDEVKVLKGVGSDCSTAPVAAFPAGKWLDTSGNGYDFFLGSVAAKGTNDPTFNGTAGGKSSAEYFSFDGGDFFTYDTTNETWMQNLHKDNAAFTYLLWVYNASFSAGKRPLATITNFGADIGIASTIGAGSGTQFFAQNAGVVLSLSHGSLGVGEWSCHGLSINEATGADGVTMLADGTSGSYTSTYASPSSSSATNTFHIGSDGSGGNAMLSGDRIGVIAIWSTRLTDAQMANFCALTNRFN